MEYDKLIDTIMATEHAAQQITQEAKKESASLDTELAQECARIKESYMVRTTQEVSDLEKTVAKQTEQNITALDARLNAALAAVENSKRKYRDNWVDTLFHIIVGDHISHKAGEPS